MPLHLHDVPRDLLAAIRTAARTAGVRLDDWVLDACRQRLSRAAGGRKGGEGYAQALTPAQRSARARHAALARHQRAREAAEPDERP